MAEAIFRKMLKEKNREDSCESAGLFAEEGFPASPNAVEVCREIGVDLTAHRSHRLRREDLKRPDLFAVMSTDHRNALLAAGVPGEKILVLDIPDPYGGGVKIYRQCRDRLSEALQSLMGRLD